MKVIQEFSNDPSQLIASSDLPIKRIEKLPLPYTGNKKKLCHQIQDVIVKHQLQFETVLDAFTGSATVAFLFKLMGKKVLANDLLTNAYINAVAFVENDGIKLNPQEQHFLLHNQNPNKSTFVENNYLGEDIPGKKSVFKKFTLKECKHLDNFRANIDELCSIQLQSLGLVANTAVILRLPFGSVDASIDILKHRIKQQARHGKGGTHYYDKRIGIYYDEDMNLKFEKWFYKYVNDFTCGFKTIPPATENDIKIKRATFLANLQQHILRDCMVQGRFNHGQSLAELNIRLKHPKNQLKGEGDRHGNTEMDFFTQTGKPGQGIKWWTFADVKLPGSCLAINSDIVELLKSGFCKVDCVYFDPPYGGQSSDYAVIYRFLEEYIYSQSLEELPHVQKYGHRFVNKKHYEENFLEMLDHSKHIPIWLISYNDNAWKDVNYITQLIENNFKRKVIIETLSTDYRYLYRKKQGRDSLSKEYLLIAT